MTLQTERTTIRRFTAEDWRDLQDYVSREDVTRFEPEYPKSDAGCRDLARFFAESEEFWAVCVTPSPRVIGHIHCGLREPHELRTYNLGFVFHPDFQGEGLATEAARRVMRYAFEELHARRFESGCNPENAPSWRLLERLGMRREAHHLWNVALRFTPSGKPMITDSYVYAILREEWQSVL